MQVNKKLSEMSSFVLMLCERGLADYNPWPKSDLQPIFVNKAFLGTQPRHSFIYCLWLLPHCSRQTLTNCGRHCVDCKSCNIYLLGFYGRCLPTRALGNSLSILIRWSKKGRFCEIEGGGQKEIVRSVSKWCVQGRC